MKPTSPISGGQIKTDDEISVFYAGRRYDEPGMIIKLKPSASRGKPPSILDRRSSIIQSSMKGNSLW